jgi:class 3 adenylate cyclase/predicted ATPase
LLQIGEWLEKLGLSEYAERFAENNVDISVLAHLSDQDFKELGVSLGHRRKMLAAIRASANTIGARQEPATSEPAREGAERRQVTVMFSDLVGSTLLSARMDPEDLREVISAYQHCVGEAVRRFGGFVAKYMGDGVLVYFGYPQAHEDDAERAVRAGIELIGAIAALQTHVTLQTRIGIATGLVVAGDLIGMGESRERGIVGKTPNLAARLQAIAEPNTVVLGEDTRKLLGDLFELKDLGTTELKGIAGPTRAWAALRPNSIASRFEALHGSALTTLVGREEESELLLRRWSKAKTGEGQAVLLSGEAGIGKSRLTAMLMQNLVGERHVRLRYFCSPQHTDSALYPIIGQMERAAGLAHDDTPQGRLDKLDVLLAQTSTPSEDAAFFSEMLSLTNDGRYPSVDLDPPQRRQRTLELLNLQMTALSRSSPLLMVFDDAHWADPTSLEVLSRTMEMIADLPVLLIVTFRPEFEPPWVGRPHVTSLTINRLTQREIRALVDHIVGNKHLPAHIRENIIERTDGIPLFIEEMSKAVLEAESTSAAEQTVAAVPSPALSVPASLHASLMARLDRLGSAKDVAQVGAAIGREFSHTLLAAVGRQPEAELEMALDRLIAAGLLYRQGVPPHASYLFNHALVRDAAYGTLLRDARRELHARIAGSIESQFAELAERQPELLARHHTEAGHIEKAALQWGRAGQRSLERSALAEAAEQIGRALKQIATLPSTSALRRKQIELQVALITPLVHLKGFAAPETKAAEETAQLLIEQAEKLGEPVEDPLLLFAVLYGVWAANYIAFNGSVMHELAARLLALAEKQSTRIPLMMAHRVMGGSLVCTGDFAGGRMHEDLGLALYDPFEHRPLAMRFGQDAKVVMLLYRSIALWALGYPDAARADVREALKDARELGQAATQMFALLHASWPHIQCGNYRAANAEAEELATLAEEKRTLFWQALATATQGCLAALSGNAADAVRMVSSGMKALRSTGATLWTPLYLSYLTLAHAQLGQFDDAWRCIEEAMTAVEATNERWYEAEVYRVAGETALMPEKPDRAKAEAHFVRALAVARRQQAKSWELRAATSLARLRRDQGKRADARELLAPVYEWFTEGFDTPDLKEAKALLAELAS